MTNPASGDVAGDADVGPDVAPDVAPGDVADVADVGPDVAPDVAPGDVADVDQDTLSDLALLDELTATLRATIKRLAADQPAKVAATARVLRETIATRAQLARERNTHADNDISIRDLTAAIPPELLNHPQRPSERLPETIQDLVAALPPAFFQQHRQSHMDEHIGHGPA